MGKCKSCFIEKPQSDFYLKSETGRHDSVCKKCRISGKKAFKSTTHKTCKHCGEEKPFYEYQKAGGGKWLQPYCKPCDDIRKEKHRNSNHERYKERALINYHKNKKLLTDEQKELNEEKRKVKMAEYYDKIRMSPEEKKSKIAASNKSYRERNKDKIKEKRKAYQLSGRATEVAKAWQARKMVNTDFRIKKNLRSRIYVALKRGIKSESTMKLLGCSIEYFKSYFESLFTEGMSWEKYLEGGIHIDHIIPCKNFDLTKPEEQKKCFHYTNLQPLFELDNLRKGTSLNYKKIA